MKKTALVILLILMLLGLIAVVNQVVEVTEANFVPGPPSISIDSPKANETCSTNAVWLNITIQTFFDYGNNSRMVECSLDGKENITIPISYVGFGEDSWSTVTGSVLLHELSEGSHSVTIYATYHFPSYGNYSTSDSRTSNFMIDFPEPTPSPEPEFFPATLVITSVIVVAVIVGMGLFIYFKKPK